MQIAMLRTKYNERQSGIVSLLSLATIVIPKNRGTDRACVLQGNNSYNNSSLVTIKK